jgi:predicted HTH domain antitoxin
MEITVHLPDDIAQHENGGREALEALVVDGYRENRLTQFQGAQLLGMSRFEFWDFMAAHGLESYTVEQLEHDIAYVESLPDKRVARR